MQVAHREFSTAAEVIQHAADVRKRLMNARRKGEPAKQTQAPPAAKRTIMRLPAWMTAPKSYDEHFKHWEQWFAATPFERCRLYLARRAVILGFSFADIRGTRGHGDIVEARHLLMWEIAFEQAPEISYSQIARLFHRDHTTVIHSLQRTSRRLGIEWTPRREKGVSIRNNPDVLARIKLLLDDGMTVAMVAEEIGASTTSVWDNARLMGWIDPAVYKPRKGNVK